MVKSWDSRAAWTWVLTWKYLKSVLNYLHDGAPRGFAELGREAIYFQWAGEHWQAHNFEDSLSPAKKVNI